MRLQKILAGVLMAVAFFSQAVEASKFLVGVDRKSGAVTHDFVVSCDVLPSSGACVGTDLFCLPDGSLWKRDAASGGYRKILFDDQCVVVGPEHRGSIFVDHDVVPTLAERDLRQAHIARLQAEVEVRKEIRRTHRRERNARRRARNRAHSDETKVD